METNPKQKTLVRAVVAPGSANSGRYNFDFSLWKPTDQSNTLIFSRELDPKSDDHTLLRSVEELQKIILALFLIDSIPRRIYFFEYGENLSQEDHLKFWRVFGQPRTHIETEEMIYSRSFSRIGPFNISRRLD